MMWWICWVRRQLSRFFKDGATKSHNASRRWVTPSGLCCCCRLWVIMETVVVREREWVFV